MTERRKGAETGVFTGGELGFPEANSSNAVVFMNQTIDT
jgi:hypothetical protein